MEEKWVSFLKTRIKFIMPHDRNVDAIEFNRGSRPWGLVGLYALVASAGLFGLWTLV